VATGAGGVALFDEITAPAGCKVAVAPRDDKGLSHAVCVHALPGREVDEAVLAFRGTDDPRDWLHNFRLTDEQAVEGERVFREFAGKYRRDGVERISVTGHSLGGGLALRMSFLPEGVPATVFHWAPSSPPRDGRGTGASRLCVWENNEILEFVRAVTEKRPALTWEGTRPIRANFSHDRTDRQHKMEPLARSLVLAAAPYDEALAGVARNLPA
jgi:hypothetical protein